VPDFADDPVSEVERMAVELKVVALVETVTYLLLAYFWLVADSRTGTAIVGSIHGIVWLAFAGMVVLIRPKIGWTWGYVVLVVVTGPIGGLLVFTRLQREGVPRRESAGH
jgi:hypothetical protein